MMTLRILNVAGTARTMPRFGGLTALRFDRRWLSAVLSISKLAICVCPLRADSSNGGWPYLIVDEYVRPLSNGMTSRCRRRKDRYYPEREIVNHLLVCCV